MIKRLMVGMVALMLAVASLSAQNTDYVAYIDKYKDIAITRGTGIEIVTEPTDKDYFVGDELNTLRSFVFHWMRKPKCHFDLLPTTR